MLLVLSPAKSLDFESPLESLWPPLAKSGADYSLPEFMSAADTLNRTLRKLSPEDLSALMSISPRLGELNFERNLNWSTTVTLENARPALFTFTGDVYVGLDVASFSYDDLMFAQDHLRILSGLYGLLRPLDLMQAYRLEMGTSLKHDKFRSLYAFWGDRLGEKLRETLLSQTSRSDQQPALINLASTEYFRAVDRKALALPVISPVFKDYKNGQYKIISFFAKKARGTMAAYLIKNRIDSPDDILQFDVDGYRYSSKESTADSPVFLRKQV